MFRRQAILSKEKAASVSSLCLAQTQVGNLGLERIELGHILSMLLLESLRIVVLHGLHNLVLLLQFFSDLVQMLLLLRVELVELDLK